MNVEQDTHAGAEFIRALFGPTTERSVFITSLPNSRDAPEPPRQMLTRDIADIARFVRKMDRAGRGLFFCVGTIKPNLTRRAKENIAEIIGLHADIDLKSIDIGAEEVLARLDALRLRPSYVVASGHGFHAYWLFREAILATPETIAQIEAALRLLADLVGGDPVVCEVSRLMRLPGSHNTKNGGSIEVRVIRDTAAARYELDELEEWLAETSPAIPRLGVKEGEAAAATNPFLAVAAKFGFKPPIDVEQRLAAMAYQGAGDASIHQTQLQVSAALLRRGTPLEDVVGIVYEATCAAAGPFGARWNWQREDRAIRRMCEDWLRKNPQPAAAKEQRANERRADKEQAEEETVIQLGEARAKRTKKTPPAKVPVHHMLGEAVIAAICARGDNLLFTPKAAYRYIDKLWRMETDGLRSWLDVEIEKACREIGVESANRIVNETRQWITRNPDLWCDDVTFDAHGMVPTRSGLVDPDTLKVIPPRSDQYATWRIECDYDPAAQCPWWQVMLNDSFEDRTEHQRQALIALVQELHGAALLDRKPRELSKAMILRGGSNFGKSALLEVLGGLFGPRQIATGLTELEEAHGLMAFTQRLPWVLHEAFDQRKWHFSSLVKAIITGEPVSINIKHGPMLSQRVTVPIFWGTNHPPQFRETTKAIVNRLVIIECRREFADNSRVGAAAEAGRRGFDGPSAFILRTELPGLLNWAIQGLQRARRRGFFELPEEVKDTLAEVRKDSNLVAGFIEECIDYNPYRRVSVPDFCAAFSVWWLESKGEDRRLPSNDSIGKAMIALGDRGIAISRKELRDERRRYYCGIILNPEGLKFWQRAVDAKTFEGKTASTTTTGGEVNTMIPESWNDRRSVRTMRLYHTTGQYGRSSPSDDPSSMTDDQTTNGRSCDASSTENSVARGEPRF